ncbi:PucR family transcriptional regulator [Microbacterium deminutum]|uniref:PucR family transcriptional regulator n=1 Tax=Microbacterium deminutum TaxID=344164 RepID=A0ABN2RHH9_9MICO
MNNWVEQLAPHSAVVVADAASDPKLVGAAIAEIGVSASEWAIETAQEIISAVQREFAASESPGVMTGREREAFEASLFTTLMALHNDTPAGEIVRPRGAEENVRESARQGVPMGTLLRTVWACHTRTQDALLRELEELFDPAELMPQVRTLNAALYSYVDLYVKGLTTEYQNELIAWSGHVPAERLHIMRSLLEGEQPTSTTERALGLRLTDHHLIGVAWQWSTRHIPDRQAELSRFGAQIGQALGASNTLVLHHDGLAEYWWTFSRLPDVNLDQVANDVTNPPWARLAIGELGAGLEGFRSSYATAQQAAKVGRKAAEGDFWSYSDVRLIALLSADEAAARRFVRDELQGLDGDEPKIAELRNTLRLFLKTGNSRILAARELHLAANTVAYRVGRASELLGRPATERPVETLLALELAHHFPAYLTDSMP